MRLPHGFLGSPSDSINQASSLLQQAQADYTSGDNETDDGAALTDYKVAASGAATSAGASAQATSDIAAANARAQGYDAAAQNELASVNASLASAQQANDRASAQAAASAAIAAATSALNYATLAQALPASGGSAPGITSWSSATIAAAQALQGYLTSNGCDCSGPLGSATAAFQSAYNADAKAAGSSSTTVDSKYGPGVQKLLASVLGSAAPSPCWGAGNPCFGKQPGGVPALPSPPVPVTPQPPGKPAPSGNLTPVSTLTTTAPTNWTPWIIAGVAIATGAGIVWYTQTQKHKRVAPKAAHERHRRRS